jgi:hypothetical protein
LDSEAEDQTGDEGSYEEGEESGDVTAHVNLRPGVRIANPRC